jgi:hypothetical protein
MIKAPISSKYLVNKLHKSIQLKSSLCRFNQHTRLSRVPCGLLAILGLNAFGLRSKVDSTASRLAASFSTLL